MLPSFTFVKDSKLFPLDAIVGALDWKHKLYSADFDMLSKHSMNGHMLTPVFLIQDEYYIPHQFNKANTPAYPGMSETNLNIFENLHDIKYTTIPVITENINDYEYGLLKWINNASTLFEVKEFKMENIKQIIECGLELNRQNVFHLDLNFDNILIADRVYFIDPSLAKDHCRPLGNYFNERAITYHWSPEILFGGNVTEKSSIYSLGKTITFCYQNICDRLVPLLNAFLENNPSYRPSFVEAYEEIKRLT